MRVRSGGPHLHVTFGRAVHSTGRVPTRASLFHGVLPDPHPAPDPTRGPSWMRSDPQWPTHGFGARACPARTPPGTLRPPATQRDSGCQGTQSFPRVCGSEVSPGPTPEALHGGLPLSPACRADPPSQLMRRPRWRTWSARKPNRTLLTHAGDDGISVAQKAHICPRDLCATTSPWSNGDTAIVHGLPNDPPQVKWCLFSFKLCPTPTCWSNGETCCARWGQITHPHSLLSVSARHAYLP